MAIKKLLNYLLTTQSRPLYPTHSTTMLYRQQEKTHGTNNSRADTPNPTATPTRTRVMSHSTATTKAGSGKSDSFYEVAITASLTSPEHLCYRYETLGY